MNPSSPDSTASAAGVRCRDNGSLPPGLRVVIWRIAAGCGLATLAGLVAGAWWGRRSR